MKENKIKTQTLLSVLWVFVLFNIIFRDIHQLITKGFIEEIMTGVVNGNTITDELMLIGGFLVEIPILMVLLSMILNRKTNRWINIIAGIITLLVIISATPSDMDDVFFTLIEITAVLSIVWIAWKWPPLVNKNVNS